MDAQKAIKDGISFFITPSRVLISPENEKGVIPVKYIAKMVSCSSGMQLYPLGDLLLLRTPTGKHVVGVNSLR